MVFWWTGRGYLALLTLIGVVGLFGAVLTLAFGEEVFERLPWLWGLGVQIPAAVNWYVGCRVNGRTPIPGRGWKLKPWLTRLGRHRFLSLPFELWSLPLALFGVFLFLMGLVSVFVPARAG
jgi:hypothetical protein